MVIFQFPGQKRLRNREIENFEIERILNFQSEI